jgi:hypothetical protein
MSALLASVYTGTRTTFGVDIHPLHLIELHEGSTLAYTVQSVTDPDERRSWLMVAPDRVGPTLFALMALVTPEHREHPFNTAEQQFVDELDQSEIDRLAAWTTAHWSFEVAATLHESSPLKAEHFKELREASVVLYEQSYARLRDNDDAFTTEVSQ